VDEARPTVAVLVVGTDDWAIEQAAGSLSAAGVEVLRCHEPGEPAFPCNAFIPGRRCPLSDGFDVVLTARARPSRTTEPGELGIICGLRADRPLVVAGVNAHNPFSQVATTVVAEGGDAAKACRHAAGTADDGGLAGGAQAIVDLRATKQRR
jgi:hypothetical protein